MRRMFSTIAPRYDFITRAFSYGMDSRWKRLGVERAGLPPSPAVLDLASGTGDFSALVGRRYPGARAVAVDLTERMLRLARQRGVERSVCGDAGALPFADGSFDFVTSVCVLHHVHGEDRPLLVEEIRRVMSPMGLCCIIEHNPWNPVTQMIVKRCPVDADAELITARETSRLLRSSGLMLLRSDYFLYLPESLFHVFGAVERVFSRLPLGGQYAVLGQARS